MSDVTSAFEQSAVKTASAGISKLLVEIQTRLQWANPTHIEVGERKDAGIRLTPVASYKIFIVPAAREYVALTFHELPDGTATASLSPDGGEPLGIPLNFEEHFAGLQIERLLKRWEQAKENGVFSSNETAALWFAGVKLGRGLVEFETFSAALNDKQARERCGIVLTPAQLVRLSTSDSAARDHFDAWSAHGQPNCLIGRPMPTNSPNWSSLLGALVVVMTVLAFSAGHFPIPLAGIPFAVLGYYLSRHGGQYGASFGGRGTRGALIGTIGGFLYVCWAVVTVIIALVA